MKLQKLATLFVALAIFTIHVASGSTAFAQTVPVTTSGLWFPFGNGTEAEYRAFGFGPRGVGTNVGTVDEPVYHNALDVMAPVGTPIYAIADGVIRTSNQRTYTMYGDYCGAQGYQIHLEARLPDGTVFTETSGHVQAGAYNEAAETGLIPNGSVVRKGQYLAKVANYRGDSDRDGDCDANDADWAHDHHGIRVGPYSHDESMKGYNEGVEPATLGWVNPITFINAHQRPITTHATHHFCTGGLMNSEAPNYAVTCNTVPGNANYPNAGVFYAGEDIILNARYENVYGSAYLRVYVERDGLPFTSFTHDSGPWDYSNDPHTAHITPIVPSAQLRVAGSESFYRFFVCLDPASDTIDVTESTCKARPDFNVAAVLLPGVRPGGTLLLASSATADTGIALLDAGNHTQITPLPPAPTNSGAITLRTNQCHQTSSTITSEQRLQVGLTNVTGSLELRLQNGSENRQARIAAGDGSPPANNPIMLDEDTPGTWAISVCASVDSSFTLAVQTVERNRCAPGVWRCSDPFPSACPPWGTRKRKCTLANTGCLHPLLVKPAEVETCAPPACQPAFAYRIGGAPRARAQEVELADLNCPSALEHWRYTTPLPAPRVGPACTEAAGCIICTGGVEPGAGTVTDVMIGCPDAQGHIPLWNQSPYHLPVAMSYHHAWVWQDKVCVMEYHRTRVYCASFDQATQQFTEMWRLAEGFGYDGSRSGKGLAIYGDQLCMAGGLSDVNVPLSDTQCTTMWWEWNQLNLRRWTIRPTRLPIPRYDGNLLAAYGSLLHTGGIGNIAATDMTGRAFLLSLDPSQTDSQWVECPTFAPGVYNQAVFTHGDKAYIAGGIGPNGAVPTVHTAVFLGQTVISPWQLAAPLHNGAASTAIVVIERPAVAVAVASPASAGSPDAGLPTDAKIEARDTAAGTVAVDAGVAATDSGNNTQASATGQSASEAGPPPGYVAIPAGTFLLGSPENEPGRWGDEGPQIQVAITRDFWMKATEVTCDEWRAVMGNLPDTRVVLSCANEPANYMSFDAAIEYVNALSSSQGLTPCFTGSPQNWTFAGLDCQGYRLPTEAEWEYAAKAGTTGPYDMESIGRYAWYQGNSDNQLHPVGLKEPNTWGLYDIIGNAHERTCSQYIESGYNGPRPIPAETCSMSDGVKSTRGGAFGWDARTSRPSTRGGHPSSRPGGASHGLRPVRTMR